MSQLEVQLVTDTWVNATWEEYIKVISHPAYEKAKSYYFKGKMRLEMSLFGNPHSRDQFYYYYCCDRSFCKPSQP